MKIKIFYLFICHFTQIVFPLGAQDTLITDSQDTPVPEVLYERISIDLEQVPLRNALSTICEKGKFHLNYSETLIPPDKKISIHMIDERVVDVLKAILKQTDLDFAVSKGGQIVLVKSTFIGAMEKYTLSGFTTDRRTGEALMGTNVYVARYRTGSTSNAYGFYSLTLPAGDYTVQYRFIGYESEEMHIRLDRNIKLNMGLNEKVLPGETVTVTAEIKDNNVASTELGTIQLTPQKIRQVPILLGEQDILRTIHLLPGVAPTREADCGFYVRGGNSDQNLVLLDEAPVYNASHFLGTFSVFNSDAIKDVKLIKGSAPPRYGGRLSSVLDIQMNEGNLKNFHGDGGIGLIFSRLTLQGPIVNDKSSFMISGRRTYVDLFAKLFSSEARNARFYFYDFNVKINYRGSERDRFYLSGYFGNDVLGGGSEGTGGANLSWGNKTGTWRWNHLFSDRLFLNTSLVYSRFKYGMQTEDEDDGEELDYASTVSDLTLKEDFEYFINPGHTLNFGLQYMYHVYQPARMLIDNGNGLDMSIGKRRAHEAALYFAHIWKTTNRLTLDYGIRYYLFAVAGNKDLFDLEEMEDAPNEFYNIEFHEDENKIFSGIEPRISANLRMNSSSSLKVGFARNYQNVHLLSSSTSGTPLSVWHPSSSKVKPQRSDQITLGYFRNFRSNLFEMSIELYYKDLRNQIDYEDGANFVLSNFFESELAFGRGWTYGAEFFLRKRFGRLTGWVGYTLSRSKRKFEKINNGVPFPARNDRPHDFSAVFIYKLSDRWTFSLNCIYFSGTPVTIPYANYTVDGRVFHAYTSRNGFRMPAYHRMDIGLTYKTKKHGSWNFSLYNAYGRKNVYTILFRENERHPERTEAVRLSICSFMPSISYNFSF
jgi:hypothetical protein